MKIPKATLITDLYDCEIAEMRHIEPLLSVPGTDWYRRVENQERIDPKAVSYLWDAKPTGNLLAFSPFNWTDIISFHTWGAPSLFKPSLAEVYSAIRRFMPDFRNVRYFYLRSHGMGPESIIDDCHWCYCRLFGEADCSEPIESISPMPSESEK